MEDQDFEKLTEDLPEPDKEEMRKFRQYLKRTVNENGADVYREIYADD